MDKLFVYGTLKDAAVQRAVIGRVITGKEAELHGFELSSVDLGGTCYPMIRRNEQAAVTGIVLEVTAEELTRLDEYETDAYSRERVTLANGDSSWTYCEP